MASILFPLSAQMAQDLSGGCRLQNLGNLFSLGSAQVIKPGCEGLAAQALFFEGFQIVVPHHEYVPAAAPPRRRRRGPRAQA